MRFVLASRNAHKLAEYRAITGNEVLVVFDARRRVVGSVDREIVEGVEVRYGNAHESADHVIERLMYEASRRGTVLEMILATDDHLQRDHRWQRRPGHGRQRQR